MKTARAFRLVLVTAPNCKTARKLATAALEAKIIACASLIPALESHYWWQGKIERANEVLILFKTTNGKLSALERLILSQHPYDSPEILALPLDSGTPRYLDWITTSTTQRGRKATQS